MIELTHSWKVPIKPSGDFITNIRYDQNTDSFIFIHEASTLDVVYGVDNIIKFANGSPEGESCNLRFESNIYDALRVGKALIVSNRAMPVRLYSLPSEEKPLSWGSFSDKKQNSQLFLSPLQFAKYEGTIVGGGKKFLSQYDCNKLCVVRKVKEMGKKYVSSVELLNDASVAVGQFDGTLTFLDLRSEENGHSIKPHLDLVTRIKRVPEREYQLITMARKDNYTYLWDSRKLDTFITYYQQPLYKNQRIGLDITSYTNTLVMGSQTGIITGWNIDSGEVVYRHDTTMSRTVSSVCCIDNGMIYGVGEREFPLDSSQDSRGSYLGIVRTG